MEKHSRQLCWTCRRTSYGLCPWFSGYEPVNGWDATPTKVRTGMMRDKSVDSYHVKSCPLYEKGRERGGDIDRNLVVAIVLRAIEDWRYLCKGNAETKESNFAELKDFFVDELPSFVSSDETADRIWRQMQKEKRRSGL